MRFGIAALVDQVGGRVVEGQQSTLKAQDRTRAGTFDAGAWDAFDATHGFQGQRGAAAANFDNKKVTMTGALFIAA